MRLTSPGLLDILAKELPNIVNDLKQQIANLSPAKRRLLEQKLTEYTAGRSPTIFKNRDDAEPTPLSYNQQRLWFVHQLLPEAPLFNQVNLFQIHGHLDIIALRKALHAFIERHDTLRTTFHIQDDGQLVQIVSQQWSLGLPVIRLNNTKDSINDLRRLAQTEGGKPFDLSQDLLMRGIVYEFDKNNYALFLLHHHISSDYWSKGILNQELSALYSAELAGQSPSLEPLPIRYADFAYWQREQAANSNLDERLANWRQALPDPLPVLSLPTNQQQSPDTSHTIFNYESLLSEHLLSDLSELARSANVTLFMSILAAYSVLLYRYFRDNEFIVGTILSGRGRRILEPLFGNFINLLPIPISVNDSQSFLTLLQQVREKAINAYAHQDLPFEKLVGELQPERDLNRAPVFQTYLNFLNSPSGDLQLEGLDVHRISLDFEYGEHDLYLTVWHQSNGLACRFSAKNHLFTREALQRMSHHFQVLLQSILEQPERAIRELTMMTPGDLQQVLYEWNDTNLSFPSPLCAHQLFEEQVKRTPKAVAIDFNGQQLSYAELNEKGNQLANHLRRRGIGPESVVAICIDRCPELIIGIMGILKSGAAFQPIDPTFPLERKAFMLGDAQTKVLLAKKSDPYPLPPCDGQTVYLDQDWPQIIQEKKTNLPNLVSPENAAYIIYTSGSTGLPKGTVLLHRGLHSLIHSARRTFDIFPNTRILQFSSISFDVSLWDIFLALANGGTLCMAEEETLKDPANLLAFLRNQKINIVTLTPTLLAEIKSENEEDSQSKTFLPDLGTIIVIGEPCSANLVKQWAPGRLFYNAPAETTIVATIGLCNPDDSRPPSIGHPIDNTRIYILDNQGQPVPIGIPGELYISGSLVGRGYLNKPILTQNHFLTDPFSEQQGTTMYRTGDIGRWREDGSIEFLGRRDFQIKLRGQRIELNEIQIVFGKHPGVQQNVVELFEDSNGEQHLIAYYVPQGEKLFPTQIREQLNRFLPSYMVPSQFIPLESLPLNASGKVDRQALPGPNQLSPDLATSYTPPRTADEKTMCGIWAAVLNLERVGIHDDFFALGGHSLLGIRIIARIKAQLGWQIAIRALFESPTIAQLAAAHAQSLEGDDWDELVL